MYSYCCWKMAIIKINVNKIPFYDKGRDGWMERRLLNNLQMIETQGGILGKRNNVLSLHFQSADSTARAFSLGRKMSLKNARDCFLCRKPRSRKSWKVWCEECTCEPSEFGRLYFQAFTITTVFKGPRGMSETFLSLRWTCRLRRSVDSVCNPCELPRE